MTDETPAEPATPSPRPARPQPPRLRALVELSDLRLFETTPRVDTPFPLPAPDRGQWLLLVGENGVGKTTFLRALALALAPAPVASKLLDDHVPMVRNGARGRVVLDLDGGRIEATVAREGRTEQVEQEQSTHFERPWVVGYGVRRGNARGEPDRRKELGAVGELHTLFDHPASLYNAPQWLADLEADVLREKRSAGEASANATPGPRERVWLGVKRALGALLELSAIEVVEGGVVMVEHEQFGRVRLDALSDGYLTTAGWVIDMIARWVERQYELGESIERDILAQMCGFVLIDEIDLHLHPTWQLEIVADIRRLFPRLSFVVTTHNPLTLQGARPGEVYVMRRAEGGAIELAQRDIQPGHDVDRVLFKLFDLEHTFDADTRKLLARHRALVKAGAAPTEPERLQLEAQLNQRFGGLGRTLVAEREAELRPLGAQFDDETRARLLARFGQPKG